MHYKYCPECGEKLNGKPAGDEGLVPFCEKCGKFWFDTFASCVIILVANEENEIALLQQGYLSNEYRSFVSGYIKPGDNAEDTARREVQEEIGLELERLDYAGTYWFAMREQLMHGFIGYAKKKELVLSQEVDRAEWVPYDKAPMLMFPDMPGNAMHPIHRQYLKSIGKQL